MNGLIGRQVGVTPGVGSGVDTSVGSHPSDSADIGAAVWRRAERMAAALTVDPGGLGGIWLRAFPGPVRDVWRQELHRLWTEDASMKSAPAHADIERLAGGLDLAATLAKGAPVLRRGVLAEADGGVLTIKMAERLPPSTAGILASALDEGVIRVERDGFSKAEPARFCLVLSDEGVGPDETAPTLLRERLAFAIDLAPVSVREAKPFDLTGADVAAARERLTRISPSPDIEKAIAAAGPALGAPSPRAHFFVLRAARALAALRGAEAIEAVDAAAACDLVYALRATASPTSDETEAPEPPAETAPDNSDNIPSRDQSQNQSDASQPLDSQSDASQTPPDDALQNPTPDEVSDLIVAAARAGTVAFSQAGDLDRRRMRRLRAAGRGGAAGRSKTSGRPKGARPGDSRGGGRLDLLATLRAAAPWRKLRPAPLAPQPIRVYPSDIRIKTYEQKAAASVIFVVDASGSAALGRLAEAKGAVERLLQDCYARRDWVSVVAFRGRAAEMLLEPTRSLVRARRSLAGAPGGGGTPLASALLEAGRLAEAETEKGRTPMIVILSDGRGNIDLSGAPGRDAAAADEKRAARRIAADGASVLFFDTGARPSPRAKDLSAALGADYTPLPYADSRKLAAIVGRETQSVKRARQ
ncbi:MAG: magnesium chelatase subunit D [Pseudomonadota bacterium]